MSQQIEQTIKSKPKVFLAACTEWCGPCRRINIDELQELMPDVHVEKVFVDAEESAEFASKHGIKSVPTVLMFKDGELVQSIVGLQTPAEYKRQADELLG